MPRHYDRAHPGTVTSAPKQNPEAYRGYLIRFNALSNTMWIEKGAAYIASVPNDKSWAHARKMIDELVAPAETCSLLKRQAE